MAIFPKSEDPMEHLANQLTSGDYTGIVSPLNPVEDIASKQYVSGLAHLRELCFPVLK
jgi:hypothetical protein